jgi:hypothetical protein
MTGGKVEYRTRVKGILDQIKTEQTNIGAHLERAKQLEASYASSMRLIKKEV